MTTPITCPDCRTPMIEGFIPDATYGKVVQTGWHEGSPDSQSFLGIDTGVKLDRSLVVPVVTYRCEGCGLLRSYARGQG